MIIKETSHAASDKLFFEHKGTKAQSHYRRSKISPQATIAKQLSRSYYRRRQNIADGKYRKATIAAGKYREANIAAGKISRSKYHEVYIAKQISLQANIAQQLSPQALISCTQPKRYIAINPYPTR